MNNNSASSSILECKNVYKSFMQGNNELKILNGINLTVKARDTISITGSSGSGKSTLLHLLGGLDKASRGEVIVDGNVLNSLSDNEISSLRNRKLGFIYQFHHLLPEFTALENVLMPIMIKKEISHIDIDYATEILALLGLKERTTHYPGMLSGGERQRVAIARAVINNPLLILADEPTGNLDNYTGDQVLNMFFRLRSELNTSLVMVTHDVKVAEKASRHYRLHGGVLNDS